MSGKVIKFAGSEDREARNFLKRIIEGEQYRFNGETYPLRTKEDCDRSLFKDDSELAVFEASRNPDAIRPKYAIAKVCVSVNDFFIAQAALRNKGYRGFKATANEAQVERALKGMKKGHKVPIPVLEFESTGELYDFQEGRHRAIAAMRMDKDYFPVFLAKEVSY